MGVLFIFEILALFMVLTEIFIINSDIEILLCFDCELYFLGGFVEDIFVDPKLVKFGLFGLESIKKHFVR